ncbi:MAG TPA: hypothetical protein VKU02_31675 [Gemmataceae bacterium]|nr:hypothetical protein [Gemmataceae bacterium]
MQLNLGLILSATASLFWISTASAQVFETPNGNPTGLSAQTGNAAAGGTFLSELDPPDAMSLGSQYQTGLTEALNLVAHSGNQPDWIIQYEYLSGQFSLGTYEAWASGIPYFTQGVFTSEYQDENAAYSGGAGIGLNWQSGPTDPDPSLMHWISLVYTNDRDGPGVPVWDAGNGTYYFIDGPQTSQGIPWYDGPITGGGTTTANGTDFLDNPSIVYFNNLFYHFYTYRAWTIEGTNEMIVSYYAVVSWIYD